MKNDPDRNLENKTSLIQFNYYFYKTVGNIGVESDGGIYDGVD